MNLKPIGLVGAALAVSALSGAAAYGAQGGRPLAATLSGAAEKPKPGDPDGAGKASLRVNVGQAQVCYDLQVSGIATATMAHIHKAPPTTSGPVVIPLKAPAANGKASDCATSDSAIVKDILQNPGAYYVNVHNAEFPGGAVRGQLSK